VLGEVDSLSGDAQFQLAVFRGVVEDVIESPSVFFRSQRIGTLRFALSSAASDLGTNLTFQIGDGTVMF
jgi:hypothetical protein